MKILSPIIFLSLISIGAYQWLTQEKNINQEEWYRHQFTLENIQTLLPVTATSDFKTIDNLQVESVSVMESGNIYITTILQGKEFNLANNSPKTLTDQGATFQSRSEIKIQGYDAIEYKYTFKDKFITQRFIKYKQSLVNQFSSFKGDKASKKATALFFDSLAL